MKGYAESAKLQLWKNKKRAKCVESALIDMREVLEKAELGRGNATDKDSDVSELLICSYSDQMMFISQRRKHKNM